MTFYIMIPTMCSLLLLIGFIMGLCYGSCSVYIEAYKRGLGNWTHDVFGRKYFKWYKK